MAVLIVKPYIAAGETPEIQEDIEGRPQEIEYHSESEKRRKLADVITKFRLSFITKSGADMFPPTIDETSIKAHFVKTTGTGLPMPTKVKVMFKIRGKDYTRFRDVKTGRFVKAGE